MTLFELQAWLGHRDIGSTQHYARSPRTPSPRPTATPATSNATCAPSRSWSTGRRSRTGPRLPGNRGSTTTWGTGSAATPSSSNARTGWPAPSATSTPQRLLQGAAPGGQGQPAAHARRRPPHRRRAGCGRRRPRGPGQAALPTRRRPYPGWPHPSPDRRPSSRDAPAHRRRQARPAPTRQRSMTPPGTYAVAAAEQSPGKLRSSLGYSLIWRMPRAFVPGSMIQAARAKPMSAMPSSVFSPVVS